MLVGFMAGVPFLVSKNFVRTFDDYKRSGGGRWAKHEIINQKPKMEFLGPDTDKITFSMLLRSDQGIAPNSELNNLRRMRDKGKYFSLVIGGRKIGEHFWVIENLGEAVNYWGKFGNILSVKVDVTLSEYVGGNKNGF